jgi:hypothetical protein
MKIFLIIFFLLSSALTVASIGKKRQPITAADAGFGLFLSGLIILGIIYFL